MNLPNQSSWNFFKGTWFYYRDDELEIHIHLKNNSKQVIYINSNRVSEIKTIRLKSEHKLNYNNKNITVRIYPDNLTLTSFTTELYINEQLRKVFMLSIHYNFKNLMPMFLLIIISTIVAVTLSIPNWTLVVTTILIPILKMAFFGKDLYTLNERSNRMDLDV